MDLKFCFLKPVSMALALHFKQWLWVTLPTIYAQWPYPSIGQICEFSSETKKINCDDDKDYENFSIHITFHMEFGQLNKHFFK